MDCSEKYACYGAIIGIAIALGVDIAQNQKAIDKVAEATARIEKKLDEQLGKAEKL